MRKPFYVQVKGTRYKVTTHKNEYMCMETGERLYGQCHSMEKQIHITDTGNREFDQATFIHELIHAVCYETGIRQTSIGMDTEELFCENISRVLASLFDFDMD